MGIPRPLPRQRMPEDAKKVFSGILFDIYQYPQTMFDGSVATFERLTREDSVVIIPVTPEGNILIAREQQPGTDWFTTLPCGGIHKHEDPEAAAARELEEETGYRASHYTLWMSHQVNSRMDWAIYTFIAHDVVPTGKTSSDAGERIEVRKVAFDEFMQVATEEGFQNIDLAPRLLKAALNPAAMQDLKRDFGIHS